MFDTRRVERALFHDAAEQAYQDAIDQGYSEDEAEIMAQNAGEDAIASYGDCLYDQWRDNQLADEDTKVFQGVPLKHVQDL